MLYKCVCVCVCDMAGNRGVLHALQVCVCVCV